MSDHYPGFEGEPPAQSRYHAIQRSRLQRLLEISARLSSTLDLTQLLDMVIETVTDLIDTEAASILLVEPKSGLLYFAAASGLELPEEQRPVPLEGSIAGWVARHGQALVLDDVQEARRQYAELDSESSFSPRDLLGVPLITKGRVIGVLETVNKKSGLPYSEQDVALVQALASQAAVAIENARLFQQTDLVADFMHELKTPLMALTAATEILGREELRPQQRDLLEVMGREINRLTVMAQDFLDLSRLESGRIRINRAPIDVRLLVNEVGRLQKPQAEQHDIDFRLEVPPDLPTVLGDFDRLTQVLLNLTANAIKYCSPGDCVQLQAKVVDDRLLVAVSDTGPGIAPQYVPHIFERFYRVPDEEGFSEGVGLGLAIAKRIMEAHAGSIELQSSPGEGSTFRCYLPLDQVT
jgi:signal transduction histidine kinase